MYLWLSVVLFVVFFIRYHLLSEYGGAKGREARKKLYNVHVSEIRFINNIDLR